MKMDGVDKAFAFFLVSISVTLLGVSALIVATILGVVE